MFAEIVRILLKHEMTDLNLDLLAKTMRNDISKSVWVKEWIRNEDKVQIKKVNKGLPAKGSFQHFLLS